MFGIISKYERELARRLDIAMPKRCRQNDHDWFVLSEYPRSEYAGVLVDVWHERVLECKRCGLRIKDHNKIVDFKYKIGGTCTCKH